ncbi:hypothetical protein HFO45_23050 [Rhizobium leguminosarum]|uniref:methylamine utilization protein MauJ n=1 Tax=Rhizobium leguminosarum TaxID=384 RepID=UPI001C98B891|nr:methylamine utilization protein MauJ [Rhizobium leguminosarum]MBY5651108.1 hypothetical protein [Rhizobium leguminosarum]
MRFVANFEVASDVSVVADGQVLKICDPREVFKALIRNIPRSEFTTPFLLSVHVYFDAEALDEAVDAAEDYLATCLNMLAFTTGSAFRKHRIRQIVDAEPSSKGAMRDVRMWGDRIEYDDPQPFLDDEHTKTIERLLEFDIPPAIRRALRWYRRGIDASSPDDQFTYFWFALEIVAEFQKPAAKVNDKCPHCQSALYCEKCETHPQHRPYAKQAIRALLMEADDSCDDATAALLDKNRNSLMHGATLKEIEGSLPDPHESVIDTLGRLLWKALAKQFPREMFDGSLVMGVPSTYVHYKATGVAHIQTVVPIDADGHFDLNFTGMVMAMKPFGPPQSALPSAVRMTSEQLDQLRSLSYQKGDQQEMLERIRQNVREQGGHIYALVISTDMAAIHKAIEKGEMGEWQDLFRQFIDTAQVVY